MTIFSTLFRTDWVVADGVNKDWSYDFALDNDAVVIEVSVAGVVTSYDTNYQLFATDEDSGFVRFPSVGAALAAGSLVRIVRSVDYTQPRAIGNQGRFHPEIHEEALDRATAQIQQLKDFADRSPRAADGVSGGTWVKGADNELVAFSSNGGGKASGWTIAELNALEAAAAAEVAARIAAVAAEAAARIAADTLEIANRIAGDASVASLIGGNYGPLERPDYDSTYAASMAEINGLLRSVRTNGRIAAGDGGGGTWKRVDAEPAGHIGKFRSIDRYLSTGIVDAANGGWWLLAPENGQVSVLCFDGADIGAQFNAALAFVKETADNDLNTWFPDGYRVVIPKGTYNCTTTLEINSQTAVNVEAYGATIRNLTGAHTVLKMVLAQNCTVNGLRIDLRNNNVADQAVLIAGQSSYTTFTDLAITSNSSKAGFACVRLKQGDPAGFDDNDRNKGSFWITFDRLWLRKLSGGDPNVSAIGIDAQGCQNAIRIVNGRISNVGTGVVVQNQNGSTFSGISNDVQIHNTAFESLTGAGVKFTSTDAADGMAGGAIIGCRFENCASVLDTTGMLGGVTIPIMLVGSCIISSVPLYHTGPEWNYSSLDVSITPNWVEPKFFSSKGLFIRNIPVAAGPAALRVIANSTGNGGSLALVRTDGTTVDGKFSQRPGGGMDIEAPTGLRLTGAKSISGTGTLGANLRGSVTMLAAATTAVVALPLAEPDASYFVFLGSEGNQGRLWATARTTAGFTINAEIAPVGNSTIWWLLIR